MGTIQITRELKRLADPTRANVSRWFFKTGPGQYGEGDRFIGIAVPAMRTVARRYRDLSFDDIAQLLASPIHEYRFVALEILVIQYERGDKAAKRKIVSFYLKQRKRINNWDLVDTSAPYILGEYLVKRNRKALYKLARSRNIWERRMAIVATAAFIQHGDFHETFALAKLLLRDSHDLIHKAAGWMLREVGKRSEPALLNFLDEHYQHMPRTMLRYSIERLPETERRRYLAK